MAAGEYIMDKRTDEVKDSRGKGILKKIWSSDLGYKCPLNDHLSSSFVIIDHMD